MDKPTRDYKAERTAAVIVAAAVGAMAVAGASLDNVFEMKLLDAARSAGIAMLFGAVVTFVAYSAGGWGVWVGRLFPLIYLLFFRFFIVHVLVRDAGYAAPGASLAAWFLLCLVAVGIVLFLGWRIGARPLLSMAAVMCSCAAAATAAAVLWEQAPQFIHGHKISAAVRSFVKPDIVAELKARAPLDAPDIIYIVPDRYGSSEAMASLFNIDNSDFEAALDARGFYVAPKARANYAKTFQSLASTLNMGSLDPIVRAVGPISNTSTPLHTVIERNAVQETLRTAGYDFVYLGNWWEPARRNRNADANVYGLGKRGLAFSEFERSLINHTPFSLLPSVGFYHRECERLKAQLDYLKNARAKADGPVFIFAHLTLPHSPVFIDRAGACRPPVDYMGAGLSDQSWEAFRAAFRDYVAYANDQFLEIFDANRTVENGRGFVFVIQSDEGPFPRKLRANRGADLTVLNAGEIKQKFGIINALYWDAERYGAPHLTETPINNWRIILSAIFGRDIPLLEDERSYMLQGDADIYALEDVTDVLRSNETTTALTLP